MKNISQEWDKIPQQVLDFAPHIQQNLVDFWDAAERCDVEKWTDAQISAVAQLQQEKTQNLLQDFKAAGGTDAHWNTMIYVVKNGQFRMQQP